MILAISALSVTCVVLLSLALENKDSSSNFIIGVFEGIVLFVLVLLVFYLCMPDSLKNPSAIDVYRGRTSLEVTYLDGAPVDSTVVFKRENQDK